MEYEVVEQRARPAFGFARAEMPPLALHHEAVEPLPHVRVHPVELARSIPRAEVVAPAAQDRVQFADQDPHILYAVPIASGAFLHTLPHSLHAALSGPALEEVDAMALLLPDHPTHPLVQVAAEEVEPLSSTAQVDPPRLLRV